MLRINLGSRQKSNNEPKRISITIVITQQELSSLKKMKISIDGRVIFIDKYLQFLSQYLLSMVDQPFEVAHQFPQALDLANHSDFAQFYWVATFSSMTNLQRSDIISNHVQYRNKKIIVHTPCPFSKLFKIKRK